MRKIKVLLAIRPRMLSEVVRHIVKRQPDMEVVCELIDPIGLLLALRVTEAEVIITTSGDADCATQAPRILRARHRSGPETDYHWGWCNCRWNWGANPCHRSAVGGEWDGFLR